MSEQYSDIKTVKTLVDLCVQGGIREAVISPGSRNAPLIFSFSACPEIKCYTIVDERSAAFFALGMAQQLGRPVALVCTSGTAALNYAPAIAEAYYQQVPLVVITADRPQEWIDQADGQTIRQNNIYANYIKFSCTLPADMHSAENEWELNRMVIDAIFHTQDNGLGPVHINIPLDEPLYGREIYPKKDIKPLERVPVQKELSGKQAQSILEKWNAAESVMVLLGMLKPNEELSSLLTELAETKNVLVLTETTSNLLNSKFIQCIDKVLATINLDDVSLYAPDLLITFDGQVTSKNIKKLLRANKPKEHWHVSVAPNTPDTYRALTASVDVEPVEFLKLIAEKSEAKNSRFIDSWLIQKDQVAEKHNYFIERLPWCDLRFFSLLKDFIPAQTAVHVANSTPIRYVQLFDEYNQFPFFSNRGTNGIDGCTSTAVGAASVVDTPTLFITGDLSFYYDSNALWNNYLRPDFKIIVINNGGGGIFRYVSGAMSEEEMESYFEVKQDLSCEHLVKGFGLKYYGCENEEELLEMLPEFFSNNSQASVLEVKTPRLENAKILKEYFNQLK